VILHICNSLIVLTQCVENADKMFWKWHFTLTVGNAIIRNPTK